jgi:hypothetical protein
MKLFMDESGNGNTAQPLIVGAVELSDDSENIEQEIRDLHKRLCSRGSFKGHPKFAEFQKHGFHSSVDPVDVSGPFLELIRDFFFRIYMVMTDRTGIPGDTEAERIEFMYAKLLGDLLIRHRDLQRITCYIEQAEGMNLSIQRLPDLATSQACATMGRSIELPQLDITMIAKEDCMSTAIIDYAMAAASRWIQADYPTNPKDWPYRGFRTFEPYISVLYSFERGRISSRRDPLH